MVMPRSRPMAVYLSALVIGAAVGTVRGQPAENRYAPYPRVSEVTEGLSWPRGQALPRFAMPAATLDTIEVQALSVDERITFSVLQGLVNTRQPRILLLDRRAEQGRDTWARTSMVGLQRVNRVERGSEYELLARYADQVEGVVLYDPRQSPHYRNLAGTVAGLRRALPVTVEVYERLEQHGIELDVVDDLTELEFTTPIEIYNYMYDTYWGECEKRVIVSARPDRRGGDHHHTRDIAAACGAAVVWLDNRVPAERDVMRKFFADMQAGEAVVLGWYTTERSGVTTASEFGIGTMPADHFMSASVYSGTGPEIHIPEVPKSPPLENKAYVAIFISDGDNIQYMQRAMRRIWDRHQPSRGKVPLNWTMAPGMVDIGPGILNYYYTTATPNDCFVAGPSGMGYMMPVNTLAEPGASVGPHLTDQERMDGYARLTETYLQRSGVRVLTIWDNATPMQRASYAEHCRTLYGATVQNFRDVPTVEGSVEEGRLHFCKLVIPYVGSYEHIRRSLNRELRRWDGESPHFLAYQVAIWNEMKPDKIVELARELDQQYGARVKLVRADHYFNLYNQAHDLPFNLLMSSGASVQASDESEDPRQATDGTPATMWTAPADGEPWLEFDLGGRYQLTRYVIRHAGAHGADAALNTRDFAVLVSDDGAEWQTVDQCRENTANVTDVELDPVTARHVKLIVSDGGRDSTARIAEVELYGRTVEP